MSLVFRAPRRAIDLAMARLRADGIVHPDAEFNPDAPGHLRREVAYYDRDFMDRLGRTSAEAEVVDSALDMLKEHGLVDSTAAYDAGTFDRHRVEVRATFSGSWTSFTPTMERLIYMLTSVRRPRHLLELGSFWGYTLAWFAGPCVGTNSVYAAERVIGIDINRAMTEQAKVNFGKLPNSEAVTLVAGDARSVLADLPGPFDFVYIEAKNDEDEEPAGLYLELLKQVYDRMPAGAWVIAHDSLDWTFAEEMAEYLPFVRESGRFSESVSFEVDECGLELSVK
jgi:predicted O-methyltransferase YrrM